MLIINKKTDCPPIRGNRNEIAAAKEFAESLLSQGNHELWWVFEGFVREGAMVIPALFVSDGNTVHFPFPPMLGDCQEFILSKGERDYMEFDPVRHHAIADFLIQWKEVF